MGKLVRWCMSTNHKDIGTLYLLFGLSFRLVGSALSAILRLELNTQGHSIMDGHGYNVVVTGHGLIMIFFFVMPMLIGRFDNWLIPLMVGTPDMAWPRLNNFSFWLLAPSVMCLLHGLFQGRIGSGWTMYVPLSRLEQPMDAMIFSLVSLMSPVVETPFCSSTCSGSLVTPRFTSSSCLVLVCCRRCWLTTLLWRSLSAIPEWCGLY